MLAAHDFKKWIYKNIENQAPLGALHVPFAPPNRNLQAKRETFNRIRELVSHFRRVPWRLFGKWQLPRPEGSNVANIYIVKMYICFIYIHVYLYVYMYITILTAIILHKSPNYIFSIIRKRDILCYIYNMILYHVHYLVPPHSNCEMMNDDHFSKSPQKLYHSPNFIFQSNR